MRDAVTAGVGLLAGIALLVLTLGGGPDQAGRGRRDARVASPGSDLGGNAVVFGIVLGGVIADTGLSPNKAWVQAATCGVAFGLIAALLLFRSTRRTAVDARTRWLLLATWAWTYAVDLAMSPPSSKTELLGRSVSGVFLVVLVGFIAWSGVSLRSFALATAVVLSLVGLSLPLLAHAWSECSPFKCGVLGVLLKGPYPSENDLGMLAAWVAALALVGLRGSQRWLSYALALAVLVASDSRTSLYITLVLSAAYLARGVFWRHLVVADGTRFALRRGVASVVVVVFAGVALTLLYTAGPHTLSNRGASGGAPSGRCPGTWCSGSGSTSGTR